MFKNLYKINKLTLQPVSSAKVKAYKAAVYGRIVTEADSEQHEIYDAQRPLVVRSRQLTPWKRFAPAAAAAAVLAAAIPVGISLVGTGADDVLSAASVPDEAGVSLGAAASAAVSSESADTSSSKAPESSPAAVQTPVTTTFETDPFSQTIPEESDPLNITIPYYDITDFENHDEDFIVAPIGTPIYADADGTVKYAGWFYDWGVVICLSHDDGTYSVYGHITSDDVKVNVGDFVKAGDLIGSAGTSGRTVLSGYLYRIYENKPPMVPKG